VRDFDVEAFLAQPLTARVETNEPIELIAKAHALLN
jgi:hypothetical protein